MGDKEFSSFSFSSTAGGSGSALTASQLNVGPEFSSDGPGLLWSSGAITVTQGTASDTLSFVDVTLDYTVTSLGAPITDADLVIAGGTTGGGAGNVSETITGPTCGGTGCSLTVNLPDTSDMVTFDSPVSSLDVVKDILVEVPAGATGSANITAVSQQFSQTSVPEPATLAIVSAGLLGIGIARRRRRG